MARRVPRIALSLLALAGPAAASGPAPSLLVSHSFEEDELPTGPDTFAVFEHGRGRVDRSAEFAVSGWGSIRLEDVARDGDFPELQGYFPLRRTDWLYAHFALLVTDPAEELNVALAGPAGFELAPDGIALWLRVVGGELVHVSDSIPRRLLALRPFVWYGVDLAMNLDAGTYDLEVWEEGLAEPVVQLVDRPNAASAPGSAVDKFSFIGDLPGSDRSNVVYFVDDVILGVDEEIALAPLVAPGRRRLFFERCRLPEWRERSAAFCPSPPPAGGADAADPGADYLRLVAGKRFEEAVALARERAADAEIPAAARAIWLELAADAAFFRQSGDEASELLEQALALDPERTTARLRQADLAFLAGDHERERALREAIYGSLGDGE
jgi:hypothetical protein